MQGVLFLSDQLPSDVMSYDLSFLVYHQHLLIRLTGKEKRRRYLELQSMQENGSSLHLSHSFYVVNHANIMDNRLLVALGVSRKGKAPIEYCDMQDRA